MNTFKRYFAIFMTLTALASSMIIQSAHSYSFDWNIQTNSVYYEYDYGVDIKVDETIDKENNIKKDVKLTNTGKSNVYVKAMVVFTPIDKETGKVLTGKAVQDSDVTLVWNSDATPDATNKPWIAIAGDIAKKNEAYSDNVNSNYYPYVFFWNAPLTPGESTGNLIDSIKVNTTEYDVRVDIITDAIYEGNVNTWCSTYGLSRNTDTRLLSRA